jgi:hypothetical protein
LRPEPVDDFESWLIGEQALRAALERVRSRRNDTPHVEIAATEGLWWCAALDDWHARRIGESKYYRSRDGHPQGRVVAGLIYARNLSAHQLALVPGFLDIGEPLIPFEEIREGEGSISWGRQPVEIRWMPFERLPSPDLPERQGRDRMYAEFVGGRPLEEPLRDALAFFEDLVWDL